MLTVIPVLTFLLIAVTYPLFFWISCRQPLEKKFHKFHIGFANFFGGLAVVALFFLKAPVTTLILVVIWKVILVAASNYCWKKQSVDPRIISIPCLLGMFVFAKVQSDLIAGGLVLAMVSILAGLILSASIFSMNLGHWYLNVPGLPISHLLNAVYVFWILVAVRALWDIFAITNARVLYDGELMPVYRFMFRLDGALLLLALFFGTLFPLITLWFVRGTLKVKSTQSATGILYVIVSAVLIGHIAYQFYLFKFGLAV